VKYPRKEGHQYTYPEPVKKTNLTKIHFMANEKKNPIFWGLIAVVVGIGLGIWGMIKADCIGGPGCWVGSGFLKWSGGILIAGGLGIWAIMSNPKRNR
jgi:hypothetical protein